MENITCREELLNFINTRLKLFVFVLRKIYKITFLFRSESFI